MDPRLPCELRSCNVEIWFVFFEIAVVRPHVRIIVQFQVKLARGVFDGIDRLTVVLTLRSL